MLLPNSGDLQLEVYRHKMTMPNREYSKCLTAGYLSAPEASRTPTARHLLYYAI